MNKRTLFFEDLGYAKVDHHRVMRKGFPEVIFCQGKTPKQVAEIALKIKQTGQPVLATRAELSHFKAVKRMFKNAKYHKVARIIEILNTKNEIRNKFKIRNSKFQTLIITAGTADIPVAEEAAVTLDFFGLKVDRLYDVGVAGIHRLLKNLKKIEEASVIIAVAGMEGALPSVLGGLAAAPVIAVPTSVGYGASFEGVSALLTMMNSCAPGVAVVNIDNGFGAATVAFAIVNSK